MVSPDASIGEAIVALRRIIDLTKRRDGVAESVTVEISSAEANGFRAGVKWLAIAAEYGTGFERLIYTIDECKEFLQQCVDQFRADRASNPDQCIRFFGDSEDLRRLRACERYLDRLSLMQEEVEKPRFKPKGHWSKKK